MCAAGNEQDTATPYLKTGGTQKNTQIPQFVLKAVETYANEI
jgi:hypothetical protein